MPAYRLEYDPCGEPLLTEEGNGCGAVSDLESESCNPADDEIQWLLCTAAIDVATVA